MDDQLRELYDGSRDFGNKSFRSGCYAPFVSLHFTTRGDVLACCKNTTWVLGNVSRERLPEIWSGRKIHALRKALSNYQFQNGCQFCEWQIGSGDFQGSFPAIFEEFPLQSLEPEWPTIIEFAGSNACNLECVMCSGDLSSAIRANRDRLPPLPAVYSDQFFEDLRGFLPHLYLARFLGGEPFLAKECFRIWDMLIDEGSKTKCHVTTNGSQYNPKVERILEALPVDLSISLDGVTKETIEKVRVNIIYEDLMANLHRFLEYRNTKGTFLSLTYCLMRQNWHEFRDFLLLGEDLNCEVFVNTVIDPSHCSLYTLPTKDLALIVDEMERQGCGYTAKFRLNRQIWDNTLLNLLSNLKDRQIEKGARVKQVEFDAWISGPEDVRHHVTVANMLAQKGQYAEALKEVLKTPTTHSHYFRGVVFSGYLRRMLGDLEGAERDLEQALKLSRRHPSVFLQRAWIRLDQHRLKEAFQDAQKAKGLLKEGDELETEVEEILGLLVERTEKP